MRDEQGAHAGTIVYAIAADRTILRVEDLVERYAINVRMLQRLFAESVGVTPKWVIQRYRLHEAAERLANGGISHSGSGAGARLQRSGALHARLQGRESGRRRRRNRGAGPTSWGRSRRQGSERYASGTSVNPHRFSWRAQVPRFSDETRNSSIGIVDGRLLLLLYLLEDDAYRLVTPVVGRLGEQHRREPLLDIGQL